MKKNHSYSEQIGRLYNTNVNSSGMRNVTFQITDDCCCACTYCYQINKGKRYMTESTAKAIVDLLFKLKEENTNTLASINTETIGIVLDFIGGEPLMNLPIIDYVCSYFMDKCLELNHPWKNFWKASMISNGAKYFESDTQAFLNKFDGFVSFGITLDGPREIHNACRVYHDGSGNFDDAYAAFKDCQKRFGCDQTKVTIAPGNLHQINEIIDFFVNEGITQINANPVFENEWTNEDAKVYYNELKIMADKLLTTYQGVTSSLFMDHIGTPIPPNNMQTWCGGLGHMLSFDPDGKAYPCIRYMESSLGDSQPPIIIGNCYDGIYNTPETLKLYDEMTSVTRKSQSTEECFNCPVAQGCAYCAAWNYQVYGTVNSRCTRICPMHKARVLANCYYWNKHYMNNNISKVFELYLPKEDALNFIDEKEYDMLVDLVHAQQEKINS